MAEAEQVSSTTSNLLKEDAREAWLGSESGQLSDASVYEEISGFYEERYVSEVQKPFDAATTGALPFIFEPEQVTRLKEEEEEEEEMAVKAENKAETEWLEKANLISDFMLEPDSTQKEYAFSEDALMDPGEVMQATQGTRVSVKTMHEKEESVVSSFTNPEQDFKSFVLDSELEHAVKHFVTDVIQEQMISTTQAAQPKEGIFKSHDYKESQEQEIDVSANVKASTEPRQAFLSFMDEREDQQKNVSPQPGLEETFRSAPGEDSPAAPASPFSEPSLPSSPAVPFPTLLQVNSDNGNSLIDSQVNTKTTMEPFSNGSPSRSGPRYDPDVLNQSDDDLMLEMKKNPFQDFLPVDEPGNEFARIGENTAGVGVAVVSDSPSPDLVQNAHDGEPSDEEEQSFESREAATESLRQQLASSDFFSSKDHEDSGLPPSLPDILKSSPLKPEKVDSGSSEGSPDFSPVHGSGSDSPNAPFSLSANNPFAFETKVPLLKEMTEETEARAAEKAKQDEEKPSEQTFGTFDLVKEAEISPMGNEAIKTIIEEQDNIKTTSQDTFQAVDKFECLNFPPTKGQEHSDSESPSADSLSPVLEAMAKNPESFQIEPKKNFMEEELEAADEVSEQEVSSEEFEFVEKPPRGAVDEFLETLENAQFAKASEVVLDEEETGPKMDDQLLDDQSSAAQETKNQSSYLLLTDPSDGASPARGKVGLDLSDFQVLSQAPSIPSPAVETETATVKKGDLKDVKLPNLNAGAVVELLYWRNVRNSGIVFGASLLLLLSLSVCSIISVLSYVALALLSVTISFRIYKGVLQAIQKSDEGHPFKMYLQQDVALPEDMVHKYTEVTLGRINTILTELRRLFLVEDLVDSLKFAIFMWVLTYIGAFFNGLTVLILGLVGAFTCPMVYEKHQVQIDHKIALVSNRVKDIAGKVQAKIPGAKKKAE